MKSVLFAHEGAILRIYGAPPTSEGALLARKSALSAHYGGLQSRHGAPPASEGALLTSKGAFLHMNWQHPEQIRPHPASKGFLLVRNGALYFHVGALLSRCGAPHTSESALLTRKKPFRPRRRLSKQI